MEFLQEPTFTAFLALVLSFLVAKIVAFAVSNSTNPDVDAVVSEAVAKDVILEREMAVRSGKGEKIVKFVDEVVIRRVDRYEGSENLVLLDDAGEVIDEEKSLDEISGQRVDKFGGDADSGVRKSEEECCDERGMGDDDAAAKVEGSEKTEMLFEKEAYVGDRDGVVGENVEDVSDEDEKREVGLGRDDAVTDGGEGNGGDEEIVAGDVVVEKKKVRDESDDDDDDDWEGVESSELEKGFAEAVNYVECGGKGREDDRVVRLGSDVQMQLYGLHKVALEGPCREPQPMALMLSSRTKWNAWQRLGSMSRELAMEQYIEVLSKNIPEWMREHSADDDIQRKMEAKDEISVAEHKRESEVSATQVGDSSTSQSSLDKVDAV